MSWPETITVSCGAHGCPTGLFPMTMDMYERVRRTGEDWYCPSGHCRHYPLGPSELDLEREKVAVLQRQLKEREALWQAARPLCRWYGCEQYGLRFASEQGLAIHMQRKHGMPTWAQAAEEEGEGDG